MKFSGETLNRFFLTKKGLPSALEVPCFAFVVLRKQFNFQSAVKISMIFLFRFRVTRRRPPRMMSSSTNHRPNSHSVKCRHRMMSSSANYRPFLSSFPYTSPQESFVYNNVVVFEKIMLLMNFYFATSYSH